jgi:UDP-N-acetylmuramoyl-L-alanyl-D-glutamate--2,6-diaminopimelate ligase
MVARPNSPFTLGVTGTNGKTSTTLLIAEILRQAGLSVLSETTLGVGTQSGVIEPRGPEPFVERMRGFAEAGVERLVLEVTSEALAHGWAKRWRFDLGVFTNLSRDHLNAHGSFEHYLASKAQLFVHLREGSSAVLNACDEASTFIERVTAAGVRRLYFAAPSRGKALLEPSLAARACSLSRTGTAIELEPSDFADALGGHLEIRLIGAIFAENALAAALAALAAGVAPERVREGLLALARVPGRFEIVVHSPCVVIDYAHTEDALGRTCDTGRQLLDELGGSRLIVVFGAGGDRDAEKRVPMGEAVGSRADLAIVTNDNPRDEPPEIIANAILAGLKRGGRAECVVELDRARAIARALDSAKPNDVVLICGKGHETEQTIASMHTHFDDAACVRALCSEETRATRFDA